MYQNFYMFKKFNLSTKEHFYHLSRDIFFLGKLWNIIRNAQSLENIATRWWCGGTLCQHRMALMCPLCLCSPSLSKQNVCATAKEILISIKMDNKRLSVLINLEHETMNAWWSHSWYLIESRLLSIVSNQNVLSQGGSWKWLFLTREALKFFFRNIP